MAVEFRLLGPVEARIDNRPVELGHARQRCVLAVLLIDANQWLSADRLLDRAWGERIPRGGRDTLYGYLSRLRRSLRLSDEAGIVRRDGGYVLTVDEDAVDLHRFRRLLAAARAADNDDDATALFKQALELWRGEPCAGLDTPWMLTMRAELDRQRWAAELDYADLRLRAGRHTDVLADLTSLNTTHPLDERLAGQFMLALYRSGRQADALDHYQRLRTRLADELGTDPGRPLQQMYQRILAADPVLATPSSETDRSPEVPRQLPAAPALFTGRVPELAELDRVLTAAPDGAVPRPQPDQAAAGTMVISAIGGVGGIGKTWLALVWAHRNVHRFPDGQLFVDLRGFSPTGRPTDLADALRGFLIALGVHPAGLPSDLDALAARYRGLVAGKRMLVVLDNAATADQVVPLLPGGTSCTVLVTSRARLPSLIDRCGARHLPLDILTRGEARELLATRLRGQRADVTSEVIDELTELCGRHPLALAITARHAATRPQIPLGEFVAELRDLGLEAFDHDIDPAASLPAVLSWSLRWLTDRQRTVFALLGPAPGPDIGLSAAACLTGLSPTETRKTLRVLEDHSLLDRHAGGRFAMHDLVRAYATSLAHDVAEPVRRAALDRVVDFHLHTAYTAERVLDPYRPPIRLDPPVPDAHPQSLPDRPAAWAWLDTHHPHLLAAQHTAAVHRRHHIVWRIAWTLCTFHRRRGRHHDDLAVWEVATEAADQLPDPAARILAHRLLGHAHAELDHHEQAILHLHEALGLAEQHHELTQQAHTHHALGWAWEQRGDDRKALEHARRALSLFRVVDSPVWEAVALNAVGWTAARLGEYDTAREHCQAALVLHRRYEDPDGEADALDSLGFVAHHTGHHQRAIGYYRQALTLYRDVGNTTEAADTLDNLGHPYTALGNHALAHAAWRRALELYREQGRDADAERVRQQLDVLTRTPVRSPGAAGVMRNSQCE
ncbi:BTAD domain-containing putative transcriptional regulator [Amycolatopsis umgeniensis]|uniref:DNA-binding SARP family transcriptional activator/Tfp pilus assembly protein PilF n=1 Tax=Amycolatopsis umgeniensis TaxID=336628 RepID=A0A841AV27_9PSEU|nr:BTAD domain-containing putative transcriptional regulator [Amycolatopsis umgeniensis]MBB5850501.1 DNA-binding SARP family transcriptional activator/Tfp pilus assembly protein PilF [Amycolatopsis umgeniensis]